MASANFTVNGLTTPPEISVSGSSTVNLALISTTGVRLVEWSVQGNHSSSAVNPTITSAGSPSGATASFTMPPGASQGYLIQCKINGGVDETGQEVSNYTKRAIVGVVGAATIIPFVVGETYERSSTHGYTERINTAIAAGGGGGGGGTGDVAGPGSSVSGDVASFSGTTGKLIQDSALAVADVIKRTGTVAFTGDQSMGSHKLTTLAAATTSGDALSYPLNLATAAVSGALPFSHGGTGLTTLGTAGQSLRVNTSATGYEFITPAAGLTVPGGDGFRLTYSATTTDADPGAGVFRANNATWASVTNLYVDLLEFGATDITTWLDSLDDSVGSIKGRLRLASISDPTKWVVFNLTGWTTATGYRKLTVVYVAGPGGILTTAGDTFLSFDAMGMGQAIVNADVDPAAAIAGTKISPNFGSQNILTTGKIQVGPTPASTGYIGIPNNESIRARNAANSADIDIVILNSSNQVVLGSTADTWVSVDAAADTVTLGTAGTARLVIPATFTALQQVRVNSGATALEFFSPPSPVIGTDLTNANVTKNISDGSQFTLPASTLASSTKTLTLGTSGTPEVDEVIEVIVYSQSQNYVLANGGPLADTLYTVIAGTKRVLHAKWNGTDWRPAGKLRLT